MFDKKKSTRIIHQKIFFVESHALKNFRSKALLARIHAQKCFAAGRYLEVS